MKIFNKIMLMACLIGLVGIVGAADVYPVYGGKNVTVANGTQMVLHNNVAAKDPSYLTLTSAMRADKTDTNVYVNGTYRCTNYAQDLHNNLEAAGVKTAIVIVTFKENPALGHALNAVKTLDKGIVYVDCCPQFENKAGQDGRATVVVGSWYKVNWMFSGTYFKTYRTVKTITTIW